MQMFVCIIKLSLNMTSLSVLLKIGIILQSIQSELNSTLTYN